jgi:preprotein translocase subunit SecG
MDKKKGTAFDYIFIVIIMVIFAIVTIVSVFLWDTISTPLKNVFGSGSATDVMATADKAFGTLDYIFLFVFFGLSIAPIIFAFLVKSHPIFFVVNILILVVMFLVMPTLSNVVREFWSTDQFSQYAEGGGATHTLPIMTRVFQYLPYITGGMSIILTIAMFVKPRDI